MKRLLQFSSASLLALPLLCSSGCQVQPTAEMTRCVDYNDRVVAPSVCTANPQMVHVQGSLHEEQSARDYYGGFGSYDAGSKAWGGSDRPLRGHIYENARAHQGPPPALDSSSEPYTVPHSN